MFRKFVWSIKVRSNVTLRAWSYQCESILAQRSRRIQQLFSFYQRVYGPHRLNLLLRAYRKQLQPPLHRIMLGAVGFCGLNTNNMPGMLSNANNNNNNNINTTNIDNSITNFNWSQERLSLSNFDACQRDIEFIESLPRNKLCDLCKEKRMNYCYCLLGNKTCRAADGTERIRNCRKKMDLNPTTSANGGSLVEGSMLIEGTDEAKWEPYFCKDEFSIWRREERPALFAYKVYARFDDVTPNDFLHVQTDLDYRKQWDESAVALELIETDPTPGSNSHLIYWEMQWPRLFANRDYVYCRRYMTDDKQKVMLVCSRGTQHSEYPVYANKVRVTDYWSLMVIKPTRNFQEPGLHYVLTYFDDPGIPIPQSIKSWVTQKQMPDFLRKMYIATKQYSVKKALEMQNLTNLTDLNILHNKYTTNEEYGSWLGRVMWKQRERGK